MCTYSDDFVHVRVHDFTLQSAHVRVQYMAQLCTCTKIKLCRCTCTKLSYDCTCTYT